MKVMFVYTDIGISVGYSCGIGVLSAYLKVHGHETKLIHVSDELDYPLDIERIYGITGGNIFHGAMSVDQMFFSRPVMGWARYRTPIRGLYLCGSGAHPGGGVMGVAGYNAAGRVLKDLRR